MDAKFLAEKFTVAQSYPQYVAKGTGEQQRRWRESYELITLAPAHRAVTTGFVRESKILVISGLWCGDCIVQCPMIQRLAESNPRINLRFIDRDEHQDLSKQVMINAGLRIPVALFMAEDFEFCFAYGDRTLSRYRAMAAERLGPMCPSGVVPPGPEEMASTLQEWLNELERVHLLLRLSPRLREKHGD